MHMHAQYVLYIYIYTAIDRQLRALHCFSFFHFRTKCQELEADPNQTNMANRVLGAVTSAMPHRTSLCD